MKRKVLVADVVLNDEHLRDFRVFCGIIPEQDANPWNMIELTWTLQYIDSI